MGDSRWRTYKGANGEFSTNFPFADKILNERLALGLPFILAR
jgi:hypothetical protein